MIYVQKGEDEYVRYELVADRRGPGAYPTNDRPSAEVLDEVVDVLAADRDADDPAVLRARVDEREHVAQADADVAQARGGP